MSTRPKSLKIQQVGEHTGSDSIRYKRLKIKVSVLALLYFCLVSWTAAAAAEADQRHPEATAPQVAEFTFQTLDGGTQQVNPEEVWRIRATYTSDEPPGAVVLGFGTEIIAWLTPHRSAPSPSSSGS